VWTARPALGMLAVAEVDVGSGEARPAGVARMELRQLRYFVALAEELHFGRAAAREHIVQSALSQQLQRLERELGARLLERSTHHVQLTPAGSAFLIEARRILAHVERVAVVVQRAAGSVATLRVGVVDASYDSMPLILRQVREQYPDLEIHELEAGVPEQLRMLLDGRLDVGLGRAWPETAEVAAELFRLDPLGVLVPEDHRLATVPRVPVATLAAEPLLLAEQGRAPEFNQFVIELCRSVGFVPRVYRGTVESLRAAADLVLQGRCVVCVPASCVSVVAGIVWRPLVEPVSRYPWSVLWRAGEGSEYVRAVVAAARRLARELGWLQPASQAAG
jgi:DNA-binding transcriptional LysR family regulator